MSTQHLQGSGSAKLAQMIRRLGYNDFDRYELATVITAPPSLKIQPDNSTIDLDGSDLVVAEHLTEHTRTASIDGGADSTITFRSNLAAGDRVIIASMNGGQTYVILDKAIVGGGE